MIAIILGVIKLAFVVFLSVFFTGVILFSATQKD